jgi:hypothetical protein
MFRFCGVHIYFGVGFLVSAFVVGERRNSVR